ncbi:MAG: glycosyltransferase family 39 protein [Oscillospiraceae bacterium]|jgi:hypothetical protein|nr:glycosyltransferase family 39 protein [Oscillospiraceae bacterium]
MHAPAAIKRKRSIDPAALVVLYAALCALRIAALAITPRAASVIYDEFLYVNAARSLFAQGRALFYGQPIAAESLLYPLLISPLFALPESIDILRAIRIWNTLVSNLALFVAFATARRLTRSRKAAWFVTLYLGLMPEMTTNQYALAENILLPLTLFALYAFLRACDDSGGAERVRCEDACGISLNPLRPGCAAPLAPLIWGGFSAIASVLTYFTKPGYAALPTALFAVLAAHALRERDKPSIVRVAVWAVCAAAAYFSVNAWFASMQSLPDVGATDLYAGQLSSVTALSFENWLTVLYGTVATAFMFTAAFAFFPALAQTIRLDGRSAGERALRSATLIASALMVIGIGYAVFLSEAADPITDSWYHLRYLYPFTIPVIALALSPSAERSRPGAAFWITAGLMICGIALIFPPKDYGSVSFQMMSFVGLRAFGDRIPIWAVRCATAALVAGMAACWRVCGFTRALRTSACALLLAWAVLSTGMETRALIEARDMEWMAADTQEALEWARAESSVFVCEPTRVTSLGVQWIALLLREDAPVVTCERLPAVLIENGSAVSFTPPRFWREAPSTPARVTRLILDAGAYKRIQPSPEVVAHTSADGAYVMIDAPTDRAWFAARTRSIFAEMNDMLVYGSQIEVYEPSLLERDELTLKISLTSKEDGYIEINVGDDMKALDLKAGEQTLDLTFAITPGARELRIFFNPLGDVFLGSWQVS